MPEKTVLITGVGPGTGSSLARCFHKEGYKVAMIARNRERLDHLESELENSKGLFVMFVTLSQLRIPSMK